MGSVLITGGAGFIGSHLTERLIAEGYHITVVDDLSRGNLRNLSTILNEIQFVKGNITDYDLMSKLVKNSDITFHLASLSRVMPSIENPELCFEANVHGTEIIARLCSRYGKKLVFSSSREVYGTAEYVPVNEGHPLNPENPYGASKVCGEKVIDAYSKCYGLNYLILRLTNVYGERDFERVIPIFMEKTLKNEAFIVYGGQQILDFVHVNDAIEAFMHAFDFSENLIFNIGSGEGVTVLDLVKLIGDITNCKNEIVLREKRKGEVERFVANIEKAKRLLHWVPKTKLREGVSRLLESYRH